MALDPNEEFFATGSADGDIKASHAISALPDLLKTTLVMAAELRFLHLSLVFNCVSQVWSLATQHILYAFPAEHSRSSFFRSMGQGHGVNQVS